jgi:hypothetical protein
LAKTLKGYTVQTKSSLHAQSQVAEEALREFFEKRDAKIGETWYFERVEPTE